MSKWALVFALLVSVAAPAAAQVKPDADPARFDVADANDDDKVDRAEYGNFVEEVVLLHDTDRDGKLSRSEVADAPDPSKFDKIDADRPELLVYERRNDGSMKLVALEYLIFQSLSNGRPSLFGQPFDEIKADNRYGIPASWALHAWIWKPNPSGMLYAWNPRVDCGPGAGS